MANGRKSNWLKNGKTSETVPWVATSCRLEPHDLRHRRATLWHLGGVPIVGAAAWLGHSPQEPLKTYAHATLADRTELEHAKLLRRVRTMLPPVLPPV